MTTRAFRKASIKDVARRAGVSTTTVSCFVNGREDVCAPETAERIRTAIADLHYFPSSLTRGLRRGETHTLGVCLTSPLDPEVRFGGHLLAGIWRGIVLETDTQDYALLHYPFSVRSGNKPDAFLDGRVDGLLFHGGPDPRPERAARAGMPVVLITRSRDLPEECGAVYADERQTVALGMEHLSRLGHRRIAHLAGPVRQRPGSEVHKPAADIAVRRLEAYTHWQIERREFDPGLIGYADAWRDEYQSVGEIVRGWRSLPAPPTAVLCANDLLALAVLEAALSQGWQVPGELSVVGIDNSTEAREARVPLTSIAVPVEEIGREGVRCLLRLMGGAPLGKCRVALPVTELIVRGSTARSCRDSAV